MEGVNCDYWYSGASVPAITDATLEPWTDFGRALAKAVGIEPEDLDMGIDAMHPPARGRR